MDIIFNLIVGAAAGYGARYVEAPIGAFLKDKVDLPEADLRVLAFIALMIAASLLIGLSGANGMPLMLLVGGALGIFATLVMKLGKDGQAAMKAQIDKRKGQAGDAAEDVKDAAKGAVKDTKAAAKKTVKKATKKAGT